MKRRTNQKFMQADLVQVAEDLGPHMDHFLGKGQLACVCASYFDLFGGGERERKVYKLLFVNGQTSAWYLEHQLTLIEKGCYEAYENWLDNKDNRSISSL